MILGFSFAAFIGWITGEVYLCLLCCCTIFLSWHLYQLHTLQRWLLKPEINILPDRLGTWGATFKRLQAQEKHQKTDLKHLEKVVEKVKASTNAFRDAALMMNAQGELEWWNPAANRLLGLKLPVDSYHPLTHYIRSPEFKVYFDAEDYSTPLEITSPVDHNKTLELYITFVDQRDRLIIFKDISQLKQHEAMRHDFIANASHELRTPLTVIAGYLETFLEYKHELPAHWARALSQMDQQSRRMQGLISDLLMLSKLESKHQMPHRCVPLRPLLQQIIEDAKTLSAGKHTIQMSCEELDLKGCEMSLSSAFSNVIFNAVKYTPEKGHIHIRGFKGEKSFQLRVNDTGIGISAIHLPRLTERFYRADPSRHSDTGGTGLGLAIVKHILLHHGGHIEIKSTIGKGSSFTCHLPLDRCI